MNENNRFVFKGCVEHEHLGVLVECDLHLNVTYEGIILDVVTEHGEVIKTASLSAEELEELCE